MKITNLKEFEPTSHPTSKIFKKHKIPLSAIAAALHLSYGHVCSILSGIRRATPEIDLELKELAKRLEGGGE